MDLTVKALLSHINSKSTPVIILTNDGKMLANEDVEYFCNISDDLLDMEVDNISISDDGDLFIYVK